jgi:hypothetical protein
MPAAAQPTRACSLQYMLTRRFEAVNFLKSPAGNYNIWC